MSFAGVGTTVFKVDSEEKSLNYSKFNVERARTLTLAVAMVVMVLGIGLLTARTAAAQGKIVFTSWTAVTGPEIYSANADGTNRTRLTNCACSNGYADISPDGTKVVFMSDRDEVRKYEIYIMDIDGSNQTRLTYSGSSVVNNWYPSFAPDGTIVWERIHSLADGAYRSYIVRMPQDGVGQFEIITFDLGTHDPEISPDGTKLLFQAGSNDNEFDVDIYVYDMVSHVLTNLTPNSYRDYFATFSPDGTKILFTSEREANYDLWLMNVDGSNQVNLTPGSERENLGAFSPDGSKIIYTYQRDANQRNYQIYSMNADGTNRVNVSNNLDLHEYAPSWGGPYLAPSITAPAARTVNAGSSASFALGSFSDQDGGGPWTAVVNWGDGTADTTFNIPAVGTIPAQSHTYARAGTYTMSITVTDSSGLSDTETSTITALNVPPTITAASGITRTQAAGASISQIATVNDPSDPANELSVTVNGGPNATVNGVTVSGITVNAAGQVNASIAAACGATNASFTLRVTDPGSLSATTTLNVTVLPETTPPVINPISNVTVTLPPNSNATSMPVSFPLPTATDNCSVPTVTTHPVSGSVFNVGTTTVNVTARDANGNTSTATFTVSVRYNFTGFSGRVESPGVNTATAGNTLPIKFSLSGNKGLNIFAPNSPSSQQANCSTWAPIGASTPTSASPGLLFNGGQYTYYWTTNPAWAGTCRVFSVTLNDGTTRLLRFSFFN
jgi:Tol biopolymer transport system component